MASNLISNPYTIMTDPTGGGGRVKPIANGEFFYGEIDKDPVTNPIKVFYKDETETEIELPQPIRTNNSGAFVAIDGKTVINPYTKEIGRSSLALSSNRKVIYRYLNIGDQGNVGSYVNDAQEQLLGQGAVIFPNDPTINASVGNDVDSGTTHIRFDNQIFACTPAPVSGEITSIDDNSAVIGGVSVKLNPVSSSRVYFKGKEMEKDFVDGTFTYKFDEFLDGAFYYVYSPDGAFPTQRLFEGNDYSKSGDEITLTSSWSGGVIVATTTVGVGAGQYEVSLTQHELKVSTSLFDGDEVVITELGNARYVIKQSGYKAITGDISMDTGQVASLQADSTGQFNVLWFGAFNDIDNTTDQVSFFSNAALRSQEEVASGGQRPPVVVPTGTYRILSDTTTEATWILQSGATITGEGGVPPTYTNDTQHLKGTLVFWNGIAQSNTLYIGDPNRTYQKLVKKGFSAEIICASGNSTGGLTGITTAGMTDDTGSSRIGVNGIAINDNYNFEAGVWGMYIEAYRMPGVKGNAFGMESTTFNLDKSQDPADTPNRTVVGRHGLSYNLWLTTGSDRAVGQLSYDTTAAIGILGKEGTYNAKYNKGIIFKKNSVAGSNPEAISMPVQYRMAWWDDKGLGDKRRAYIAAASPSSDGQLTFAVRDDSKNSDAIMIMTPGNVSPAPSSAGNLSLGTPSERFNTIYLVNSPDVNSDENLKKQRGGLTDGEIKAALRIAAMPRMFQWIDETNKKHGKDGETVYLHCSPMAQEVWVALEESGLDPTTYGFINNGDFEDAKWSIQPQELLWMICAAQQSKINDFESRLAALENNNG